MIHFFVTHHHRYTVEDFVDSWVPELRERITIISYEKWPLTTPLLSGTCIFTDLERLLPFEISVAKALSQALQKQPDQFKVVNAPEEYLGRFNLLKRLHASGINTFAAVRLNGNLDSLHYPVFIRNEKDHQGPITELLSSRSALEVAIRKVSSDGLQEKHLIVVEYCHCVDQDGIFRKYSAINIGGKIVPRHVLFSSDWSTKNPDIVTAGFAAEEQEFCRAFPHREQIEEVFKIAGVDYGRVDYGLKDGKVQVWEINTNPVIVPRREKINPLRLSTQAQSAVKIGVALRELSERMSERPILPFKTVKLEFFKVIQSLTTPWRHLRFGRRV